MFSITPAEKVKNKEKRKKDPASTPDFSTEPEQYYYMKEEPANIEE